MLHHLKNLIIGENSDPAPGRKLSISGTIEKGDQVGHPHLHDDHKEDQHASIFSPEKKGKSEADHPKSKETYHFIDYTVLPDDTLDGIAISYSLNPSTIKRDNELSSDLVYKGQVLKIRVIDDPKPEEEQEVKKEEQVKSPEAKKTEDVVDPNFEIIDLDKCVIHYCTSIGDIQGNIRFDGSMLTFIPIELVEEELKHQDNTGDSHVKAISKKEYQEKNLAQWRAEINIGDLDECHLMIVPSVACEDHFDVNQEYEMDYLLQVVLHGHGDRSLGKYLNDLFSGMREKRVPYACIHFKIKGKFEEGHVASNKQKHSMAHQIQAKIMAIKKSIDEEKLEASKEMTRVPYFEFLFDKFEKNDAELLRKISRKDTTLPELTEEEKAKILAGDYEEEAKEQVSRRKSSIVPSVKRIMIPKIVGESQILNLEQFTELINCAPELYQTLDWQMIYSTAVDGTSYQNLLRRTQNEYPTLIVIKDENDFVFGAYSSNEIWFSDRFYGSGETFLYTFRDLNEITTFYWSKKNNLILSVGEEGITFGSKPQFGLWINNELTKGRSFECETFANQMLSYKSDFQIIKLEVWAAIDPFAAERREKEKEENQRKLSISENEEYNVDH